MGQLDKWVDRNFRFLQTDLIVVGLLLIYTLCEPSLAPDG